MYAYLATLLLVCTTFTATAFGSPGQWFEVQSPHFLVLTDSSNRDALRVATQFEKMRAVFRTFLPNGSDGHSPIVVLALKNKRDFQAVEPDAYLAKGQLNLAGLFMHAPDRNYILVRLDTEGEHPYSVVYHEYTHFLTSKATWMPLWLNEGLASFYENTDIHEKEVLLGQANLNELRYLNENRFIPLATLFKVDHSSPYYHQEDKGSVFYAESWLLTYYLMVNDYGKQPSRLQTYLKLVSQNVDPAVAGEQAFGDLTRLQRDLEAYARNGDLKMFQMKTAATADPSTFQQKTVTQAEADAVRVDVMVRNGRKKDAETLLEATLKADPNNATAHEAMGLMKFREGDYESAKKWYGEAVQLDSKDCLAHYNYAMMSLRAGERDHDSAIESSLQTAIKLNPEFAPAYDALATFYAMRGKELDQAHLLNAHAIQLEPENLGYRLNAANVLSQQRQYAGAIGVLKAAKQVAKTPADTAMIDKRLQQLEQFQAALDRVKTDGGQEGPEIVQPSAGQTPPGKTMVFQRIDGKVIGRLEETPNYPTSDATGPRRKIQGILSNVRCSYPTVLALTVDDGKQKIVLYNNNYYKIVFTTANYEPNGDIKPCSEIEGMKATVEYGEVADKVVAGQIMSIELSK